MEKTKDGGIGCYKRTRTPEAGPLYRELQTHSRSEKEGERNTARWKTKDCSCSRSFTWRRFIWPILRHMKEILMNPL